MIHKKNYTASFAKLLVILISFAFFTSCISQKQIKYVQDYTAATDSFPTVSHAENTIQPFDELYIKVLSYDQKTYQFFNNQGGDNRSNNDLNINLISYSVNSSGYIDFPFLGKISVKNLTLEQAKERIEEKLSGFLKESSVIVKFVGNYVTILGEVRRAGKYIVHKGQINIFQAIGMAGDITDYGNRKKITLIREENSAIVYHYIDLTDKKIVQSPFYHLKPNDVIYIAPLKAKSWGFKSFPYSIILSSVTTLIVVLNFMNSTNK